MSDGMISSKILNVMDIDHKLKDKYGKAIDSLSEDELDKVKKEFLDDEQIKEGVRAKKNGQSEADKKVANDMAELEKLNGDGAKKNDNSSAPISEKE